MTFLGQRGNINDKALFHLTFLLFSSNIHMDSLFVVFVANSTIVLGFRTWMIKFYLAVFEPEKCGRFFFTSDLFSNLCSVFFMSSS